MGVAVRVSGFGFYIVLFIMWVVVPVLVGFVLYLIIRLGLKHGLRSYYADINQPPSPGE
jgi:hypothetical protein